MERKRGKERIGTEQFRNREWESNTVRGTEKAERERESDLETER